MWHIHGAGAQIGSTKWATPPPLQCGIAHLNSFVETGPAQDRFRRNRPRLVERWPVKSVVVGSNPIPAAKQSWEFHRNKMTLEQLISNLKSAGFEVNKSSDINIIARKNNTYLKFTVTKREPMFKMFETRNSRRMYFSVKDSIFTQKQAELFKVALT